MGKSGVLKMRWTLRKQSDKTMTITCGFLKNKNAYMFWALILLAFGLGNTGAVLAAPITINSAVSIPGDMSSPINNDIVIANGGSLTVTGDLIFDNSTPISITIQSGGSMTIAASKKTIQFGNDCRITVETGGTLNVIGQSGTGNEVTLKATTSNGWYGLRNDGGHITVNYATITGTLYAVYHSAGVTEIYHSLIQDCTDGIRAVPETGQTTSGQVILQGNTFQNAGEAVWLKKATTGTSLICGNHFINNNPSITLSQNNNVEIRSNIFEDGYQDTTIRLLNDFNNTNVYIANNNFICSSDTKTTTDSTFYFIENQCALDSNGKPTSTNIVTIYNSYWQCGSLAPYQSESAIKAAGLVDKTANVFIKGFIGPIDGNPDTTPPVLEEVSPISASNVNPVQVTVVISDVGWGVNPDTVSIKLLGSSTVSPDPGSLSYVCNNRQYVFRATFSTLSVRNYTWVIDGYDAAGNRLNDPDNLMNQILSINNNPVNSVSTPSTWSRGSYFLVTFPVTATVLDHRTALSLTAPDSNIVSYDSTHGYYYYGDSGLAPIVPGQGFWLKLGTTESTSPRTITGATVAATEGTEVANYTTPGWYMIGSPFESGFNINQLSFTYTSPSKGSNYTGSITEAVNDGVVSYGFWGSNQNGYYLERTSLKAWEGYWIQVKKSCRILYHTNKYDPPYSSSSLASLWEIQLTANQGGSSDGANYLGLTQTAASGVDKYDLEKPPSFGNTVQSFLTPQGASTAYGVDLRSGNSLREKWNYTVNGLEPGAATINWRGLADVPSRYKLTLLDLSTGRQIDLRSTSSYQFTAGSETSRQFQVIMADQGFQAMSITGLSVTPNPFAPLRESVTVTYTLSSAASVDIRIYDWVGNLVYINPTVNNPAADTYTFNWNGRNNLGRMVANGIYFCKITARNGSAQNTQILKIAVVN